MEDIASYKFDFEAEVARIRQERGRKLRRVAFRTRTSEDWDAPRGGEGIKPGLMSQFTESAGGRSTFDGSTASPVRKNLFARNAGSIVSFDPYQQVFVPRQEGAAAEIVRLLVFLHEAGHAQAQTAHQGRGYRGGRKEDIGDILLGDELWGECAADAYAALKILQRFGAEAVPSLQQWSWHRAVHTLFGDKRHTTSPVVDKIISDTREKGLSVLKEEALLRRALDYADAWMPRVRLLQKASAALGALSEERETPAYLGRISATCLTPAAARENPLLFYLSVKALLPMAESGASILSRSAQRVSLSEDAARNVRKSAWMAESMDLSHATEDAFLAASMGRGQPMNKALATPARPGMPLVHKL